MAHKTDDGLLTPARAADWKRFVADYIALMTRTKANRALVADYSVRRAGDRYELQFHGVTLYPPMTADQVYEWAQRLPLRYFADEGDATRARLLGAL